MISHAGIDTFAIERAVENALRDCARESYNGLVVHLLRQEMNRDLLSYIDLGCKPDEHEVGHQLVLSARQVADRLVSYAHDAHLADRIRARENDVRREFEQALADGTWRAVFRGRDILRRFVGWYARGWKYEFFRETLIARMRDAELRPEGMQAVLDQIMADA